MSDQTPTPYQLLLWLNYSNPSRSDKDARVYLQARSLARNWRKQLRNRHAHWQQESLFEDLDDPYVGLWIDMLRLTDDQATVGRDVRRAVVQLLVREHPEILIEIARDIAEAHNSGSEIDGDTRRAVIRALRDLAEHLEAHETTITAEGTPRKDHG